VTERPRDAFAASLAALRRKERSSAELASWLGRRGFGAEEVEGAISSLVEAGELDDERFARRYADDKRELVGWGAERIRAALAKRGVERACIERALEDDSRAAQLERAAALLERRGQALAAESDLARALGFLTRRGYDYEIAYEAVRLAARRAA